MPAMRLSSTYFNSRPREGANGTAHPISRGLSSFQFPPPRGGEQSEPAGLTSSTLFQFPPPRGGERGEMTEQLFHFLIFQFPPPRGGEHPEFGAVIFRSSIFQFPPPRGGEPSRSESSTVQEYFNSRPREGANSKTAQNRAVYLVSLLKFGRISAILPYILSATRAKKRETPKIIGFLLRRPTGRSCMEQVGAGGVR